MGYWKTKVLPKIKKVFEKNSTKKTAAAEATKSFDESKEVINKEFEEKKTELQTKALVVYEASSTEIKSLVKARDEAGLKKHSTEVHKFIEELVKIDFPGSKAVSEASSKFGPPLISGPIFFIFEKVSTFIVTEEKVEEVPPKTEEETSGVKDREIVVEEEKKEEISEKIESVDENVERKAKAAEDIATPPADKQEEKPVEPTAVEQAEPPKA
ncbi:plasma membrane-associated cation-binding protein 1 [Trifolium pratense]|nr:plasma membrane-associated cation-binding protein 1 [Trifolium pratense]